MGLCGGCRRAVLKSLHCTHLFHLKMSLESHLLLPVLENTEYHFSCYAKTGYKMLVSVEG
jgi:hypothetical protein